MNSYFGVSAVESRHSGLKAYDAKAGLKDVSARVAVNYALTKRLSLTGSVGVSRLVGEAADSPLVEDDTQLRSVIGGSYTF